MKPEVNKILGKINDKVELSTVKVDLSLAQVDKAIRKGASQAKYVLKLEQKIDSVRKELKSVVAEANSVLDEMDDTLSILIKAGPEIQKIKKDMQEAGISTAPLDARYKEIEDSYRGLAKFRNILDRQIITARNI